MNDASAWEGTTLLSFVRSVHAGTEESRSRSDILKPLVWPLGLSLAATTALERDHVDLNRMGIPSFGEF